MNNAFLHVNAFLNNLNPQVGAFATEGGLGIAFHDHSDLPEICGRRFKTKI